MSTQTATDPNIIPVRGRLSFPHLFEAKGFDGGKPKFSCTFLLDKKRDAEVIKKVQARIDALMKDELKVKLPADKLCLRDGSLKEGTDGYGAHVMSLSASSEKRPQVYRAEGRDSVPVDAEDPKGPYAGCEVDGSIRVWAQNNKFGKRINAELRIVRRIGGGEPFGGGTPVDADAELPDVDEVEV